MFGCALNPSRLMGLHLYGVLHQTPDLAAALPYIAPWCVKLKSLDMAAVPCQAATHMVCACAESSCLYYYEAIYSRHA